LAITEKLLPEVIALLVTPSIFMPLFDEWFPLVLREFDVKLDHIQTGMRNDIDARLGKCVRDGEDFTFLKRVGNFNRPENLTGQNRLKVHPF